MLAGEQHGWRCDAMRCARGGAVRSATVAGNEQKDVREMRWMRRVCRGRPDPCGPCPARRVEERCRWLDGCAPRNASCNEMRPRPCRAAIGRVFWNARRRPFGGRACEVARSPIRPQDMWEVWPAASSPLSRSLAPVGHWQRRHTPLLCPPSSVVVRPSLLGIPDRDGRCVSAVCTCTAGLDSRPRWHAPRSSD